MFIYCALLFLEVTVIKMSSIKLGDQKLYLFTNIVNVTCNIEIIYDIKTSRKILILTDEIESRSIEFLVQG